jgi:hypothetical protein
VSRAAHVLQQSEWDGSAVDLDERKAAPQAEYRRVMAAFVKGGQ